MDLVVHQVGEFEVVHIPDCNRLVVGFAGTAVAQAALAVRLIARKLQRFHNVVLVRAVEYRGHDLPAEGLGRIAEMDLQHLPDIESGRNAEGVEHDVEGRAVVHERHILLRQNA